MGDFYISTAGAGTKDGSSLSNAMDHASVVDADYSSVTAGVDVIYVVGYLSATLTVPSEANGSAGNVQLIDAQTHDGGGQTSGSNENTLFIESGGQYIKVLGGYWESNDTAQFGAPAVVNPTCTDIEFNSCAFNEVTQGECVKVWSYNNTDTSNITLDACTFEGSGASDGAATRCNLYNVPSTSTGTFTGVTVKNCVADGKIAIFGFDYDQVFQYSRFLTDYVVEGNVITDSPQVPIGVKLIRGGAVRNNVLTNCGINDSYLLTNNIQTGGCQDLVIEDNVIDTPRNGSAATGDGAGIILDWDDGYYEYSERLTVRRNIITDAQDGNGVGISNWAARDSLIYNNLAEGCISGVGLADGVVNKVFTIDAITTGTPTIITYTEADKGRVVQDGDPVTFTNVSGISPDINAASPTYIATWISRTQFSIDETTSGTYDSSPLAYCQVDQRTDNNRVYNCTLHNNTHGLLAKFGNPEGTVQGCILSSNTYGIRNDGGQGSVLPTTEDYNCFWNNSTENIDDNGTPITPGSNSIVANPLYVDAGNDDYNLQSTSPCLGKGPPAWWGNKARPKSLNGEPLPDSKIDMGAYQSTWDENHPVNL